MLCLGVSIDREQLSQWICKIWRYTEQENTTSLLADAMPRRHDREGGAQSPEHPGPLQDLEAKKKRRNRNKNIKKIRASQREYGGGLVDLWGHAMPNVKLKAAYSSSSLSYYLGHNH